MSADQKQLSACLARYMDTKPFTAKKIGKEQAERMKVRREIATTRARAAIRFFEKPENFARLSSRLADTAASNIDSYNDGYEDGQKVQRFTLYREIDALGGVSQSPWDDGYSAALTDVLLILMKRGFSEEQDATPANTAMLQPGFEEEL